MKRIPAKIKKCYSKYIESKLFNSNIILLYHRVFDLKGDPQLLCVDPNRFNEQMKYVQDNFSVISLSQLQNNIRSQKIQKDEVAITFDDGYADNYDHAAPILEKYAIPATLFVATAYIDSTCEFYWDELEKLFLTAKSLPKNLSIEVAGKGFSFTFEKFYNGERAQEWNVLQTQHLHERQIAYMTLCTAMKHQNPEQRQDLLLRLRSWAANESIVRDTHRVFSKSDLVALSKNTLFEIGAHTETHPMLSALPLTEQTKEIEGGKTHLEEILGRPVTSFAYPYGGKEDYTMESVAAVKKAGYTCACSNFSGKINRTTDPFQLPRFIVRNWDVKTFQEKIGEFFATFQ